MWSPMKPYPAPPRNAAARRAGSRGFTLIELMIAVVVIGILAAIALPSYQDSVRKSRRSEAMTALMQIQQAQERWRGNHSAYAGNDRLTVARNADPPGLGLSASTPSGYYALSLSDVSATGYTATAAAQAGTSQAADALCSTIAVRMQGGNLTYAGCGAGDCAFAATNVCWAR